MDGFGRSVRKLLEAAALALLATAPLYLPPLEIADRLDGWAFDSWSALAPAEATPGIALVSIDTPAALEDLLARAERGGVELVVTTLPYTPEHASDRVLGPTEIAIDERRSRTTSWSRGGHLVFEPDRDGVVRRDGPVRRAGADVPSLAHAAATALGADADPRHDVLLRLPPRNTLLALPSDDAAAGLPPDARVVVAGPATSWFSTPAGALSAPELVALTLSARLAGNSLRDGLPARVALWMLALGLGALVGARGSRAARAALFVIGGVVTLVGASAAAFVAIDTWLPPTGPVAWFALTAVLLRARRSAPTAGVALGEEQRLALARDACANGRLKEAWSLYRPLPATEGLLPELYDLACALRARGADDEAADLFHRIAQIDGQFRDVAHQLVRASQSNHDAPCEPEVPMPSSIGRYRLLEPIGRGAMGHVYLGRDPIINRIVALKAIDLSVGYDTAGMETTTEAFLREATIAGGLSHPNIVTIFDVGEADGLAYIAMEYVRGHHLSEYAHADRLLPVATVLDLIGRAASALDYAHRQNVVHRDIKPANIMYDSISNSLKLTDFGIAKLIDANRTRTGIVLGTPAYMSPEQLEGRNVNRHTDLFALGVSLYQLLTGQLPFRGASMTNLMFVIANEPHAPVTQLRVGLPRWLDEVIDRALAKDPADRYQSGAEMAAALQRAA